MDEEKDQVVEEKPWPFVVYEEPGECRHGMVPEWCAICSPRGEEKEQ
jgi:hypothetical protein